MFKSNTREQGTAKREETARKILDAALELFREQGFEGAGMREIAQRAGVATGAAYYYYPSKDAIVMEFYRRASAEMAPRIEAAIEGARGLESMLRQTIRAKLAYFAPNRGVLRALLRNGADPRHPLSPFSKETKEIRNADIAWFRRILADSGARVPRELKAHLPDVLWFLQMGIILFWVIDESPNQSSTEKLLEVAAKAAATLLRFSALPLMRPLRRTTVQMIEAVKGGAV
jgi:AcrR family transcriptional regulator